MNLGAMTEGMLEGRVGIVRLVSSGGLAISFSGSRQLTHLACGSQTCFPAAGAYIGKVDAVELPSATEQSSPLDGERGRAHMPQTVKHLLEVQPLNPSCG